MALIDRSTITKIHLDSLAAIVGKDAPCGADAVYASIALRCLSEGGLLGRSGKEYGIAISVIAPDLTGIPYDQALIFICGGYQLGSRSVLPFYLYREPGVKSMFRPHFEQQVAASPSRHNFQELKLKRFFEMPSMAWCGQVISRATVFRYVAHKYGGAHHTDNTQGFTELERSVTHIGENLHLKDDGLSVVFAETIGSASFLLNSPSIQKLRTVLSDSPSAEVIPFPERAI